VKLKAIKLIQISSGIPCNKFYQLEIKKSSDIPDKLKVKNAVINNEEKIVKPLMTIFLTTVKLLMKKYLNRLLRIPSSIYAIAYKILFYLSHPVLTKFSTLFAH